MKRYVAGMKECAGQAMKNGHSRKALLLCAVTLLMPLVGVQSSARTEAPSSDAAKMVAAGMEARSRHTEKLDVPRNGRGKISVEAELTGWNTLNRAREITIPARGFYIATLRNGSVVTVINKEEKLRRAGEIWAVQDGQAMTVKIQEKRQESVSLDIFAVRPGH